MNEPICLSIISNGFLRYTCCNKAKVEREGKWYCGKHDPVRLRAIHDKNTARYEAEIRKAHRKRSVIEAKNNVAETTRNFFRQEATMDDLSAAVYAWETQEGDEG